MISPITYLKQTRDEMKMVVWPTRVEIIRLTMIVIFVSVLVGLYIGGLDLLFTAITELIIGVR
jgi:preprotein translocase subunit SecE